MTKPRIVPKWLSFLLPLSLSLAVLTTVGCGDTGKNEIPPPPPVKSSEAGIQNITISKGFLAPAFTTSVRNYGVELYSETPSINVTVTLKDTKAKLFVNNVSTTSGQSSAAIPLHDGINTINIGTVAEDGTSTDQTTLTVNLSGMMPVSVWVLDGAGGSPVADTRLKLVDAASGKVLESNLALPVGKNGSVMFLLDPAKKYHIYATGRNSAEACFANFDPSKESVAFLICKPLWVGFPAEAPVITNISYSSNGTSWQTLTTYDIVKPLAEIRYLKISAIARSAIAPQYMNNFGMAINANALAWEYNMYDPWETLEEAKPEMIGGTQYYRTTNTFVTPLTNIQPTADHWLDIIVYDSACNRTEQRIYITLTDAATSNSSDDNLSARTPTFTATQSQTFGITSDWFSISPVGEQSITYWVIGQFATAAGTPYPNIRGFEVWRATDGLHFKKIMTQNYQSPVNTNVGSAGIFQFQDVDPALKEGVSYTYKVRLFNGNPANGGYSQYSTTMGTRPMPPFTALLDGPTDLAVSKTTKPTFSFKVSNPSMFNLATSDRMQFLLYIKEKFNTTANYNYYLPGYYDIAENRFYYDSAFGGGFADLIDLLLGNAVDNYTWTPVPEEWGFELSADKTTITIPWIPAGGVWATGLTPSMSYEWSIYGLGGPKSVVASAGSMCPHFRKVYPSLGGNAFSYGSNPYRGSTAVNGYFTLSIAPDATDVIDEP